MGKKKFIDKKKSATFQLIARDSSDPNYDEGPSGDSVFVRVDENPYSFEGFNESNGATSNDTYESESIFADAPDDYDDENAGGGGVSRRQMQSTLLPNGRAVLPDNIRKEILELGFPDDGYNYLAHLREIKNTGGGSMYYQNPYAKLDQLQPDPDVKAYDASRVNISMFNGESNEKSIYNVASKTAGVKIQKVIDSEVAALLDDSDLSRFGSDVEDLEEDFVVNANLPEEATDIDVELDKELNLVDEPVIRKIESWAFEASDSQDNVARPSVGKGKNIMKDEGDWINEKPRVRRLLDEQFDMLELQEYGSDSEDEYDGSLDDDKEYHEPLAEKLNQSIKSRVKDELEENYKAPSDLLHGDKTEKDTETLECAANVIKRCMEYAEKYENEKTDDEVVVQEESSDESENYDCETIVSTYSNLDNHPGKIGVPGVQRKKKFEGTIAVAQNASNNIISLKGKLKLPMNFSPSTMGSAKEKVKNDSSLRTGLQTRKQNGQESKEEKKERKTAVKEERREARRAKKEMKGLYKGEAQHAQKVAAFTGPSSIHLM